MVFGGIQRVSTIDFPSVLSCVVFTKGCNLDCFYCHNRELIENSSEDISENDVLDFLEKRKGLLDGVVVSGGEPTIQNDLAEFLAKVKAMGYKTKLDTNGQNPQKVKDILNNNLIDYASLDIKATKEKYQLICGKDIFDSVAETVIILKNSGINFEVRTTLYPSMKISELNEILEYFDVMPLCRLNFFKMPKQYKKENENVLIQKCITEKDIIENIEDLKKLQPNLIW